MRSCARSYVMVFVKSRRPWISPPLAANSQTAVFALANHDGVADFEEAAHQVFVREVFIALADGRAAQDYLFVWPPLAQKARQVESVHQLMVINNADA